MRPLVLKIGGSLVKSGKLAAVLGLAARSCRPLVIVPGGGAYADAVRQEQAECGYSDADAHRRAILAMQQMARDWIDMQPRFVGADTVSAIRTLWRRDAVPIWFPARMTRRDGRFRADWTVTSDGLAAILSMYLGRSYLVLVKSLCVPRSARAAALAAEGIVDPQFAKFVSRAGLDWRIVGADERAELVRLLR